MENILENEIITIQTFDDDKQRHRKDLARILQYPKDNAEIETLAKEGAGVFICLNPQENPVQRLIENTKALKYFTTDWDVCKEKDNVPKEEIAARKQRLLEKIKALPLLPNYANETKHGYQCVWELTNQILLPTLEERNKANVQYQNIISGIDAIAGLHSEGDNICRVIRKPDSLHQKNPNDTFTITATKLTDKKVTLDEFYKIYPPIIKTPVTSKSATTYQGDNSVIGQIINYPVQAALEKLSETDVVDHEQLTFKENTNGTIQIIIDGQPSGQWIDAAQNTIGGPGTGQGNPSILQFVQWYGIKRRSEDARTAKGKAIRALKHILSISSNEDVLHPYSPTGAMQQNYVQKNPVLQFTSEDVQRMIEAKRIEDLISESGNNDVDWIWTGYIAKGLKTEISAFWKAGKTTLLIELINCILSGKPLAGQETKPAKIYILSEEATIHWIKRRDEKKLSGFFINCKPIQRKLNRKEWEEYLKNLGEYCKKEQFDLVVFDTISDFWPVIDENNAIEVKDALRPLNYLTEANIAVLLIHHFNREGAREGGAGRGSGALPADVDIIIDFFRYNPNDDLDTCRVLKGGNSRFEETPREIVIKLTNEGYVALGTKAELKGEENSQKILSRLPVSPEGLTVKEILNKLIKDDSYKSTLSRQLNKLEKDGRIVRTPGTGKTPDLWSRVADDINPDAIDLEIEAVSVASQPLPYTDATKDIPQQLGFDNKSETVEETTTNEIHQSDELSSTVKILREIGNKNITGLLQLKVVSEYENDEVLVYLDAVYFLLSHEHAENKSLYWKIAEILESEAEKRVIDISHLQKPNDNERSEYL